MINPLKLIVCFISTSIKNREIPLYEGFPCFRMICLSELQKIIIKFSSNYHFDKTDEKYNYFL